MLRRDEVVLATDHATQAGEVGLGLIGAHAVLAERFRVVDALHRELRLKRVPVARLIGVNGSVFRAVPDGDWSADGKTGGLGGRP